MAASPINESPTPRTLATSVYACTESKKGAARERTVPMTELRPGHLGEDPGFFGPIADRFVRGERLTVDVECTRQVTATADRRSTSVR